MVAVTAQTTLGDYRIIASLGHGGMGDVFLAVVEGPPGSGFAKLAVVKRLRAHLCEDPVFVAMLADEARLTARLSHPNIVQLFEMGYDNGQHYLAMEHLDGQPLRRLLKRARKEGIDLPAEASYAVLADVLAGLHSAHEATDYDGTSLDVVHRDVTPDNVFVTYDGAVKVVDFGIAKAAGRAVETQHGAIRGKPRYMSPEQAGGLAIDRRTDVFAVGVMLWNAATGRALWADTDELDLTEALVSGRYEASPRTVCPEVPVAIDAICRRALAFRPEDRYATAEEMRLDIEAFLGERTAAIRNELSATMRELFARERAKLRDVLGAAALTREPSVETFTAKSRANRGGSDQNLWSIKRAGRDRDQTLIMESRPKRPSIAPMVVSPPRVVPRRPAPLRPRSEPRSRWIVMAAAMATMAILVVLATAASDARSAATTPSRTARVVDADIQTRSGAARPKLERAEVEPTADDEVAAPPPKIVHAAPASAAAPPAAATAPATTAPAPQAPANATTADKPTTPDKPTKLDDTDPWAR